MRTERTETRVLIAPGYLDPFIRRRINTDRVELVYSDASMLARKRGFEGNHLQKRLPKEGWLPRLVSYQIASEGDLRRARCADRILDGTVGSGPHSGPYYGCVRPWRRDTRAMGQGRGFSSGPEVPMLRPLSFSFFGTDYCLHPKSLS